MRYEYDTVQIPPNIEIKKNQNRAAADYLKKIINDKAVHGWEFQSIETIGVTEAAGCFDALFSRKSLCLIITS